MDGEWLEPETERSYALLVRSKVARDGLAPTINAMVEEVANRHGLLAVNLLGGNTGKCRGSLAARTELERAIRERVQYRGGTRSKRVYRLRQDDGNPDWQTITNADLAAVMGYKGHTALSKPNRQQESEAAA